MIKLVIRITIGDTIYAFMRHVPLRPEIEVNFRIPPVQGFTMTEDEMLAYLAEHHDVRAEMETKTG